MSPEERQQLRNKIQQRRQERRELRIKIEFSLALRSLKFQQKLD